MNPTKTAWYRVADLVFGVSTPFMEHIGRILPSYVPFRIDAPMAPEQRLFTLTTVKPETLESVVITQVLAEDRNDLGRWKLSRTADGFCVDLQYIEGHPWHRLVTDQQFSQMQAGIRWEDPCAAESLNSFTMMGFAQSAVNQQTAMVHASVTMKEGKGYAFLGTSGTGKSTHSRLWLQHIEGTELLNDDNPAVRILPDGQIKVYGTPWSGKTPCYKNQQAELGAFVQLKQAPYNRFSFLKGIQAYMVLLSSCSSLKWNTAYYNALGKTIEQLANQVPVGFLECLPDEEAARLSHQEIHLSSK